MKTSKILVVEDDDELRRLLRAILSPVCEVVDASNGLDALCLLRREKPRLILLDLELPEMGGLAVLSAALRLAPNVVVVMLTGDDDIETAVSALNRGARAYVTKPFDPRYLREEVARLLEPPAKPGDAPWQVREGG
jgi:two-component system chemotaxis response regulator CheY